jgi:hypothetical protein
MALLGYSGIISRGELLVDASTSFTPLYPKLRELARTRYVAASHNDIYVLTPERLWQLPHHQSIGLTNNKQSANNGRHELECVASLQMSGHDNDINSSTTAAAAASNDLPIPTLKSLLMGSILAMVVSNDDKDDGSICQ